MSPFEYFKNCYTKKYADFSGRARRSEYWYFMLFSFIGFFICGFIDSMLDEIIDFSGLTFVAMLIFIIPYLAVRVRRLHDINKSGSWILIRIVPFGGLVLFVFAVMDSHPDYNEYGPNPKGEKVLEPSDHLIDDDF